VNWFFVAQGQGSMVVSSELGIKPSGSLRHQEFFDQLRNYNFLKKDSGPWS